MPIHQSRSNQPESSQSFEMREVKKGGFDSFSEESEEETELKQKPRKKHHSSKPKQQPSSSKTRASHQTRHEEQPLRKKEERIERKARKGAGIEETEERSERSERSERVAKKESRERESKESREKRRAPHILTREEQAPQTFMQMLGRKLLSNLNPRTWNVKKVINSVFAGLLVGAFIDILIIGFYVPTVGVITQQSSEEQLREMGFRMLEGAEDFPIVSESEISRYEDYVRLLYNGSEELEAVHLKKIAPDAEWQLKSLGVDKFIDKIWDTNFPYMVAGAFSLKKPFSCKYSARGGNAILESKCLEGQEVFPIAIRRALQMLIPYMKAEKNICELKK